jgi:hypothetical protein
MSKWQRAKWKSARRITLERHWSPEGSVFREATVRVMEKESGLRTIFEWHRPNPTLMTLDRNGMTFKRGDEPQDDSFLRQRQQVRIGWNEVASIKFNMWHYSAVKVMLKESQGGNQVVWIKWMPSTWIEPYSIYRTSKLYEVLMSYFEKYRD